MILDYGHFAFEDINSILKEDWKLIISPYRLDTQVPQVNISIYEYFILSEVNPSVLDHDQFIYCSQPLKEDQVKLSYDQYDFEYFLNKIFKENFPEKELITRHHPREKRAKQSSQSESLTQVLALYSNWIGHSSMVLFGSKALGHCVFETASYGSIDEELERDLIEFIKSSAPKARKVLPSINFETMLSCENIQQL